MENRRNFIKKVALAYGSLGVAGLLPSGIQRALAIDPAPGSTYLDAEHVVILMQENRSFDHCYGSLRGVRGFDDPRAINLPDGKPVWLQTNEQGETYAPFRLDIKDTKATWMGSLPHSWTNQVDARNDGKMDRWLEVKKSGHVPFAKMPLTLGYYNREDLPFYYSMADAFTVCDQNFCSSLTGTTPNRLYLWTGTIREAAREDVQARVNNEDADYITEVGWKTFPERLEANDISWKIYQNEISVGVGLTDEEDQWLTNFGDNPIEYFTQFNVRFLPAYIQNLPKRIEATRAYIKDLEEKLKASPDSTEKLSKQIDYAKKYLERSLEDQKKYTMEARQALSKSEKSLHEKAFVTNINDKNYHTLESLEYSAAGEKRTLNIPKGDLFHQFREDVKTGKLPAVSWLVAPENLSDHPSAPWYGAAYVSEAIDILTKDPEVWKKTIFILAYDENDGYFDHVAPFTAPHPEKPETGKTSASIDARLDYVTKDQDKRWKAVEEARESPIGLGFRVPLVIASPWSRGGVVNSQVFDHTSVLQFLEKFLSHKTGKKIEEPNISSWRRAVCGDLTSAFKPFQGEKLPLPKFVVKNEFYESVHQAKFKKDPFAFKPVTSADIELAIKNPAQLSLVPRQEKGTRPSCALPYQLYAESILSADKKSVAVNFASGTDLFGKQTAGAPFSVYAPGKYKTVNGIQSVKTWAYAINGGERLSDSWLLDNFENGLYHLKVYGPNGFFREFSGNEQDPAIDVTCGFETSRQKATGNIALKIKNMSSSSQKITINDRSYKSGLIVKDIEGASSADIILNLSKSHNWYDFEIVVENFPAFSKRYAGRVETGLEGVSDPLIGA